MRTYHGFVYHKSSTGNMHNRLSAAFVDDKGNNGTNGLVARPKNENEAILIAERLLKRNKQVGRVKMSVNALPSKEKTVFIQGYKPPKKMSKIKK